MGVAYWNQWSHSEIMSMQGVELEELLDEDIDLEFEECEIDDEVDCCDRCRGRGCNYCLMLSY